MVTEVKNGAYGNFEASACGMAEDEPGRFLNFWIF